MHAFSENGKTWNLGISKGEDRTLPSPILRPLPTLPIRGGGKEVHGRSLQTALIDCTNFSTALAITRVGIIIRKKSQFLADTKVVSIVQELHLSCLFTFCLFNSYSENLHCIQAVVFQDKEQDGGASSHFIRHSTLDTGLRRARGLETEGMGGGG